MIAECGKVVGCVVMLGVAFVVAEGVAPGATSEEVSGVVFGVLLGVGVAAGVSVEAGGRVLDGAALRCPFGVLELRLVWSLVRQRRGGIAHNESRRQSVFARHQTG